ncbi:hypothetical protein MKW94_011574, partial [Papaver nudicaule]|nr:hypothetical protein [Papaver nudicaule]
VVEAPSELPFEIKDNPGEGTMTLTREYQGEKIIVTVDKPDLFDYAAKDEGKYVQFALSGIIRKKYEEPQLEFDAKVDADEITINSLNVWDRYSSDIWLEEPFF